MSESSVDHARVIIRTSTCDLHLPATLTYEQARDQLELMLCNDLRQPAERRTAEADLVTYEGYLLDRYELQAGMDRYQHTDVIARRISHLALGDGLSL